ncbi:MAG: glycosyltransferase family 1 protein [Candidatus Hydrothermarchaeota archaeon]|nr:glycosyltransferase family 1 protein [Candidatus Hydrothermarchaeota archaeon]
MKIGLINDYPPTTGIGNYAFSLFSELQKMKKNVDMLYLQYKEPLNFENDRIKVFTTPFKLPFFTRTLNWYYYFPKKIPEGYDIYHISSQYLSKVAKYRKPCVVSCMDIFPAILEQDYPYPLRLMLKKALVFLKEATAIIAISEYSKKLLIDKLNIPGNKIHVVHLGVDTDVFKPMKKEDARKKIGLPENGKIILHVGSEEPRKNIPTVIKAFYGLQKKIPEALLLRVGERRKTTQELVKKFSLEKKVRHYQNVSREELVLLYNAADLFVFPSFYEGFGLPVLEAMACGAPVITSNTTSLPEVVRDNEIMIDPFNAKALLSAMYEVLSNENLRHEMIKTGLERAKFFSWERTALNTLKIYEEVR